MPRLYRIADDDERERLLADYGTSGGVYKLHCIKGIDEETPIPVPRVLGTDLDGVLYIGKTPSTQARIHELHKALSPHYKSEPHDGGQRYARNENFKAMFPFEQMSVTFTPADDPGAVESEELRLYVQRFGEVPPLNANET